MLNREIMAVAESVKSGMTHVYQHPDDVKRVVLACKAGICKLVPPDESKSNCVLIDGGKRNRIELTPTGIELLKPEKQQQSST